MREIIRTLRARKIGKLIENRQRLLNTETKTLDWTWRVMAEVISLYSIDTIK